jgi:hypothetical protein
MANPIQENFVGVGHPLALRLIGLAHTQFAKATCGSQRRARPSHRSHALIVGSGAIHALYEKCGLEALDSQNDVLFARMMSIPATTQPARAAKVRALIIHVLRDEWRGPGGDLEWDKAETRKLLGEFAGITEDELAAI